MARTAIRWAVLALALLIPLAALAAPGAEGDSPPRARSSPLAPRPKRTVLHFEDDSIRGDLKRPDGELVQAPRRVAEPSLIRLRRSFADRALGSVVRGE